MTLTSIHYMIIFIMNELLQVVTPLGQGNTPLSQENMVIGLFNCCDNILLIWATHLSIVTSSKSSYGQFTRLLRLRLGQASLANVPYNFLKYIGNRL